MHLRFGDEPKILSTLTIDRHNLRLPLVARLLRDERCLALVSTEGVPVYVAAGCSRPSVVLFGPTPVDLFGMPQNLNLVRRDPETKRVKCPLGSCFWNAGPLRREHWCASCALGHTSCANFVEPDEAAGQVEAFIRRSVVEGVA